MPKCVGGSVGAAAFPGRNANPTAARDRSAPDLIDALPKRPEMATSSADTSIGPVRHAGSPATSIVPPLHLFLVQSDSRI